MANYYVKGGSTYDDGDDPKVWSYVDINGFDESSYDSRTFGDIETNDPYFWLGNNGTEASPDPIAELGLYNGNRIEITDSEILLNGDFIKGAEIGGHYKATYGFGSPNANLDSNDEVGDTGTDITWVSATGDSSAISIIEGDSHKNVLKMTNSNWARHYNTFTATTTGTIEFYFKKSNSSGQSYVAELSENGVTNIVIYTIGTSIYYTGSGAATDSLSDFTIDTWHHFKIVWDSDDNCNVFLDGSLIINSVGMNAQTAGINRFGITTDNTVMNVYFDAIGYSWDSDYSEGDNRQPRLDADDNLDMGENDVINAGNIYGTLEYDDNDPSSYDIVHSDLTIDGSWHECDLDSYKTVPDGVVGFIARFQIRDTVGGDCWAKLRATWQSNNYQTVSMATLEYDDYVIQTVPIPLDSNHKFDYLGDSGLDNFSITVMWWIYEN